MINISLKNAFKSTGKFFYYYLLDCLQLDFCLTHVLSEKTKTKYDAVLPHIQVKFILFVVIRGKGSVNARTFLCLVLYQLPLIFSKSNNSPGVESMF